MTDEDARTPVPPSSFGQMYYQLTAELDVRFRRYVEDMGLRILARLDRAETDRRDEGRALDARLRVVEIANPPLLAETVGKLAAQLIETSVRLTEANAKLDSRQSVLRGQIRAVGWAGGVFCSVLTICIGLLAWLKP